MTKSELHHKPDPCSGGKCCQPNCNCRYSSWPIWFLYVLFAIFVMASPIIIIISINIWYKTPKPLPDSVAQAVAWCADEGSLHDEIRNGFADPKLQDRNIGLAHPHTTHPDGFCKDIKTIVHQSIRYCEECDEDNGDGDMQPPTPPPFRPPLVLGKAKGPTIEIGDWINCSGDVITGINIDNSAAATPDDVFTGDDLDLPQFCRWSNEHRLGPNNNRRLLNPAGQPPAPDPTREWELLERPRVHHARTIKKPGGWDESQEDKKAKINDLVGGPYVVFIAKHLDGICCDKDGRQAVRDKHRVTVFVLYLDWVTERPTIVEFDVEIERGKDVVSDEDTVQLISNVRLDSIDRKITFQIGQGARRIVIAGYDFSGQSTDTDVGRRRLSEEDTSGSYRITLTDDGAVNQVYRLP